jgi:hypothetical protein
LLVPLFDAASPVFRVVPLRLTICDETALRISRVTAYNEAQGGRLVRMIETAAVRAPESEPQPKPARKPYQKPEFRFERAFETMALACGKISPTQKHCQFMRKSS